MKPPFGLTFVWTPQRKKEKNCNHLRLEWDCHAKHLMLSAWPNMNAIMPNGVNAQDPWLTPMHNEPKIEDDDEDEKNRFDKGTVHTLKEWKRRKRVHANMDDTNVGRGGNDGAREMVPMVKRLQLRRLRYTRWDSDPSRIRQTFIIHKRQWLLMMMAHSHIIYES